MRNQCVAVSEPTTFFTQPLGRTKRAWVAKIALVMAVCIASLLIGGFVLPGSRKSAPISAEAIATTPVTTSPAVPLSAVTAIPAPVMKKETVPPPAKS